MQVHPKYFETNLPASNMPFIPDGGPLRLSPGFCEGCIPLLKSFYVDMTFTSVVPSKDPLKHDAWCPIHKKHMAGKQAPTDKSEKARAGDQECKLATLFTSAIDDLRVIEPAS